MNRQSSPQGRASKSDLSRSALSGMAPPTRCAPSFPEAITMAAKAIDSQSGKRLIHPAMADELTLEDCTRTYDHTELSRLLQVTTALSPTTTDQALPSNTSKSLSSDSLPLDTNGAPSTAQRSSRSQISVPDSDVQSVVGAARRSLISASEIFAIAPIGSIEMPECCASEEATFLPQNQLQSGISKVSRPSEPIQEPPPSPTRSAKQLSAVARRSTLVWLSTLLAVLSVCFLAAALYVRFGSSRAGGFRSLHALSPQKSRAAQAGQRQPGRLIELNVEVEPKDARLYLDGRAASNPLRVAYPADHSTHILRAEADGYSPKEVTIKLDRDIAIVLGL